METLRRKTAKTWAIINKIGTETLELAVMHALDACGGVRVLARSP